jgi:hypothetical protein
MKDLDTATRDQIDALFIRSKKKLDFGDITGAVQDAETA